LSDEREIKGFDAADEDELGEKLNWIHDRYDGDLSAFFRDAIADAKRIAARRAKLRDDGDGNSDTIPDSEQELRREINATRREFNRRMNALQTRLDRLTTRHAS
jgi:hypothetical protein